MKSNWIPIYGFLVLGLLLGGVGAAKAAGYWYVSCDSKVEGGEVRLTGANPSEIKGWMPLAEVLKTYKLDKEEVYRTFSIPPDIPVETSLKDIAARTNENFSPTKLRDWIAQQQQAN